MQKPDQILRLWDSSIYSGPLNQYNYPSNKEFGDLLKFLQHIDPAQQSRIHISDVCDWHMPEPDPNFDIYIVCAFGEFVNEDYCDLLSKQFPDRKLILLTSQYYNPCNLENFTVFTIEHLHTSARFFKPQNRLPLAQRAYLHATQSRRNTLHKSLITAQLLSRFPDLQYTFCNIKTHEYQLETFQQDLQKILAIHCSDSDMNSIVALHNNPREIPGNDWDITPHYTQCKLFWTTESIFLSRDSCPTAYLTEKTLKPIVCGSAWIVVGQKHSYRRIQELGFETFESEFEIDFDELNDQDRITAVYKSMDQDFDDLLNNSVIQDKIDYNYNYFFGNFMSTVEKENLPKIQKFIDYVNAL